MENKLKEMIRSGKAALGSFLTIGSSAVAEVMAQSGFDWFVVDMEHGPLGIEASLGLLQAMSAAPVTPVVRVPWNSPYLIKQALDIGAMGILVPMVNNAEEARLAVSYASYPPRGIRGISGARANRYGENIDSYLAEANDCILKIVQIETEKGIENAQQIAGVPGIDAVFIGPSDLAGSLGLWGQPHHPDFDAAVQKIIHACQSQGVILGIHNQSAAAAAERIRQGFRLVTVSGDFRILGQAARGIVDEARKLSALE